MVRLIPAIVLLAAAAWACARAFGGSDFLAWWNWAQGLYLAGAAAWVVAWATGRPTWNAAVIGAAPLLPPLVLLAWSLSGVSRDDTAAIAAALYVLPAIGAGAIAVGGGFWILVRRAGGAGADTRR